MAHITKKNIVEKKKQTEWTMKESSLTSPVLTWLASKGFEGFTEIPFPSSASFIDIVGKNINGDIICIELKMSLNRTVVYQIGKSQLISPLAYVGVATNPSKKSIEFCQKFGIGILSIKENVVREILSPQKRIDNSKIYIEKINRHLVPENKNQPAGLPNLKGTGPAQKLVKIIDKLFLENPKISWKEIFAKVPNHYSSHNSMRQGIKMARERLK